MFTATSDITLLPLKTVLLKVPVLPPVRSSTSLTLTQGLPRRLNLCLCTPQPRPAAPHPHTLLPATILSHVTTPPPLLLITEWTVWPYPARQTIPKGQVGHLQVQRRWTEVGVKSRLPHRPAVYRRGLKGAQTARSLTSPNPVWETKEDSLPETGRRTGYILTGGETRKDTTGTRVRSVMVIAASTGGTISITTIPAPTESALLTVAHTGTGSRVIIESGLSTTPGTGTVTSIPTTTATGPGRNGAVSGGATIIPTTEALRVIGSGRRSTETSGWWRKRPVARRRMTTRQRIRLPRPPRCLKRSLTRRVRLRTPPWPCQNLLQTGRIPTVRGRPTISAWRERAAMMPITLRNTKGAKKRSWGTESDTETVGE